MKATETYYENKLMEFRDISEKLNELHAPEQGPYDNLICSHCTSYISEFPEDVDAHIEWPCKTIKILEKIDNE